jgi:hypothetical protein
VTAAALKTLAELRQELHDAGLDWWVCRCGRPLYEHSARTIPSTGGREHVCGTTQSGRYEPVTLPVLDYSQEKGLHRP